MEIFRKRVGIPNFVKILFKSLIGLSPMWFVCTCVGPMWQFKHVLRHFHMCSCIVHSCCSLLHVLCLIECPCDIFVMYWTQLSANAWVYSWLNMFDMFWSKSVCFTHCAHFVPCHAMHLLLGTHYASLAALTCINTCTHMHSHLIHALCYCLHVLTVIAWCFKCVLFYFKTVMLCF